MLRFFAVHLLLWFIAQTLPLYGLVLSFLSGQRLFLTLFTVAGLGLLIFYAPRFSPYEHHDPTHG